MHWYSKYSCIWIPKFLMKSPLDAKLVKTIMTNLHVIKSPLGGGFDITSSQNSYRNEVMSKDPICYGPCGSVLLVPIFLLEDSLVDANVFTSVLWLWEQRWHPTFTTDWFQPELPFDTLRVSKLKPLYMYVYMSAPFQCFFDVVQSISVYSEKGGGGSSI